MVSMKSEKITPFGGIFHVRDHFSRFVGPVIDKVLGHRCKSFGYQSARLWVLCLVSTSVAATVWMMWRPIWCPISRFIPLFANATLTQFSGESLSWAAPTRGVFCHGWIELTSTNSRKWAYRQNIFATTQKYFVLYLYLCTRFDKNPLSAAFGKELKRVWFSALTGTTIRMKRVKQLKESYTVWT